MFSLSLKYAIKNYQGIFMIPNETCSKCDQYIFLIRVNVKYDSIWQTVQFYSNIIRIVFDGFYHIVLYLNTIPTVRTVLSLEIFSKHQIHLNPLSFF